MNCAVPQDSLHFLLASSSHDSLSWRKGLECPGGAGERGGEEEAFTAEAGVDTRTGGLGVLGVTPTPFPDPFFCDRTYTNYIIVTSYPYLGKWKTNSPS